MKLEINTKFDIGDEVRFAHKADTGIVKKICLEDAEGAYLVKYLIEYMNDERRWASEKKLELVEKAKPEEQPEEQQQSTGQTEEHPSEPTEPTSDEPSGEVNP